MDITKKDKKELVKSGLLIVGGGIGIAIAIYGLTRVALRHELSNFKVVVDLKLPDIPV